MEEKFTPDTREFHDLLKTFMDANGVEGLSPQECIDRVFAPASRRQPYNVVPPATKVVEVLGEGSFQAAKLLEAFRRTFLRLRQVARIQAGDGPLLLAVEDSGLALGLTQYDQWMIELLVARGGECGFKFNHAIAAELLWRLIMPGKKLLLVGSDDDSLWRFWSALNADQGEEPAKTLRRELGRYRGRSLNFSRITEIHLS